MVRSCRLDRLDVLEGRFLAHREMPPNPMLGWSCPDPGLTEVARAVALALDDDAARRREPPYHDRYHIAETVLAMEALCREATALHLLSDELAALGVLAMLGHDLGHDGSLAPSFLLERRAAERVSVLAAGLGPAPVAVLREVILGTAPALVPANLARAARPGCRELDLLVALANEADVLASLMPRLGAILAEKLAEEWRPHDPARAATVTSPAGRKLFLSIYAAPTLPARRLGVDAMVRRQLGTPG